MFASRRRLVALLACVVCSGTAALAPVAHADEGQAYAWGRNLTGELGDGTLVERLQPVPVTGLSTVVAMDGGTGDSLALHADGEVFAWGANESGQLGNGNHEADATPAPVPGITNAIQVAAGANHNLALLAGGSVVAWGENTYGQLGNGSTESSDTPQAVPGLEHVVSIGAGARNSYAILEDGTVLAWGADEWGQLGTGAGEKSSTPVAIPGLPAMKAVDGGSKFAVGLAEDGHVWSWGSDAWGVLGTEEPTCEKCIATPAQLPSLHNVKALAGGFEHSLALLESGEVRAWGHNSWGELGNGKAAKTEASSTPIPVEAITEATAVAVGGLHSYALLGNGTVLGWGGDEHGQVGDGRHGKGLKVLTPTPVTCLPAAVGVAGGFWSGLAWGAGTGACPLVSSVSPGQGALAGGTSVVITGARLGQATGVRFGSTPAAAFEVENETTIRATAPEGSGSVDVRVESPSGTSALTPGDRFEYVGPPSISGLNPAHGPASGGSIVKIEGSYLGNASAVSFGSAPATSFSYNGQGSLIATAPAGSNTVDVRVTTPFGTTEAQKRDRYSYLSPPEFGRCLPVPGLGGSYKQKTCTSSAAAKDSYEWFPLFGAGEPLENTAITLESTSKGLTLTPAHGEPISCTTARGGASYVDGHDVAAALRMAGCTQARRACTPIPSGESIVWSPMTGTLGVVKQGATPVKNTVGIRYSANGEGVLAEFSCNGVTIVLRGSVVGTVKPNKMLATRTWVGKSSKSVQAIEGFEGGPHSVLELNSGAGFEPVGLSLQLIEKSATPVEVSSAF
jgi:alpha-tubulin suppressor-like RCC1 family protein